jgi:hypothetical protein
MSTMRPHKGRKNATGIQKVYQELPEAQTEKEAPVEYQVMKISESIQGFHMNS